MGRRDDGRAWGGLVLGLLGLGLGHPAGAHPGVSVEIETLSAQIASSPHNVVLRLDRAALHREADHLDEARRDLRVVARLEPENRRLRFERALVAVSQGRTRAARRDLDAFLRSGEGTGLAYRTRAELLTQAGAYAQARADYDAAIALGPTPDLYLQRAAVDEARGDWDAAATGLAEGCRSAVPPVVLVLRRIDIERRREQPDQALSLIDGLLEQSPDRADWILIRAQVLADLGLAAAAINERLRALTLSHAAIIRRDTALGRVTRARINLALHQTEAARADLHQALAYAPELVEAGRMLAELAPD